MTAKTKIQIKYTTVLYDKVSEGMSEFDIIDLVDKHIKGYAEEHNINMKDITIIKEC